MCRQCSVEGEGKGTQRPFMEERGDYSRILVSTVLCKSPPISAVRVIRHTVGSRHLPPARH